MNGLPFSYPPMPMASLRETAEAKINLTLRVLGRRLDGYHELVSLVAFARLGDRLELIPGEELSLTVEGPFAAALQADNLVLKAATMLHRRWPGLRLGAFRLDKRLPVAAGLGGGSADAAAALRLLLRANPDLAPAEVAALCKELGADVPVCFVSRACLMWGMGDHVQPLGSLPKLPAVLANPGVALATADVFSALAAPPLAPSATGEAPLPGPFAGGEELLAYLCAEANDLQAPALRLAPVIAEVLSALQSAPGCRLARLTGSGATCFGLFASDAEAAAAADAIARVHPGWWVAATELH